MASDFRISRAKYKAEQQRLNRVPHERKASPATIAKQRREQAAREIEDAKTKIFLVHGLFVRPKDPVKFLADLEANKRAAALADAGKPTLAAIDSLPVDDLQTPGDLAPEKLAIPQREFPLRGVDDDDDDHKPGLNL